MMASPLSRELRERNEFYPRRLTVRKGDVVMVTRGGFGGHEGKVLDVDLKSMKVLVDGVVYQKADNTSIPKPIDPSNIEIIKLDLSDRRRKKKFERILEQSGLTEEEMREAEEELESTESITIASYEEEDEDEDEDEDEKELESTESITIASYEEEEEAEEEEDEDVEDSEEEKDLEQGDADGKALDDEEPGDVKEEVAEKAGDAEDAPLEDQENDKEGSN